MNFTSAKDIKLCLEGSYRKLKGYYFYNKNFLLIRSQIVDFEYNAEEMNKTFVCMADALLHPQKKSSKDFFEKLVSKVDFFLLPKKFEENNPRKRSAEMPVSNISTIEKNLTEVNFFIDIPIEVHILDVFWSLFIANYLYSNNFPVNSIYGNSVRKDVTSEEEIDFESNRFFKAFFYQYNSWRDNAFDSLKESYEKGKDSILFSLDLKSYFYSVRFDFLQLKNLASNNPDVKFIRVLNKFFENIFLAYKNKIAPYRKGMEEFRNNEYPLPIGLFSSMIIGNLYLAEFDRKVLESNPAYYGRYVDDMLLVYETSVSEEATNADIIERILVEKGILQASQNEYCVSLIPSLKIQKNKIKVVYIKHDEPKAIIDIYDKNIRVIPSQMDPIPDIDLKLGSFAEKVYDVQNLSAKNKIRDIGQIDISSFDVGRFFSSLLYSCSRINSFGSPALYKNISENISQIENFFSGSQCVEFFSYWGRYFSFLTMVQRIKGRKIKNDKGNAKAFYSKVYASIKSINCKNLKKDLYSKTKGLTTKLHNSLKSTLDISLYMSLSLDYDACKKHFYKKCCEQVKKYIEANYFDDSLIPIPLSNYFEYTNDISFLKMTMKELGSISSDLEKSKKLKWAPHIIYYEEVLLLVFYQRHIKRQNQANYSYVSEFAQNLYKRINFIKMEAPAVTMEEISNISGYGLKKICIPTNNCDNNVDVGVASVKFGIDLKNITDRWRPLTYEAKQSFNNVLKGMFQYSKHDANSKRNVKLLVMPELFVPIYWLKDLIRFSKKADTAIIAGMQYVEGRDNYVHNYLLNIFPINKSSHRYGRECLIYIREKNDYSPIEIKELSKIGKKSENLKNPEYQVFKWGGLNIASLVCFELTDVSARALLKGMCDVLTVSVFNPDTTYFSKIISSTSRDLHCFIAQSNTSLYGDSRITGPYDRDSKDIVRLKGGENDNVIIGSINLSKYRNFQHNYLNNFEKEIEANIKDFAKKKKTENKCKKKEKPDIKPFSARFKVKK